MFEDRRKFHFLKRIKGGHVVFEGNELTRVLGSGKANIGEKRTNAENVWHIEGLKHNILNFIQMVYGGKEVLFNSKCCFIQYEG